LSKLNHEQVRHIAALARMHLSNDDIERFQTQLSNILDNFLILEKLETGEVLPTRQPNSINNIMRPDRITASLTSEDVLSNAPHQEDQYFKVRAVLED
jgi:aspartyl-tRNA(Asn)/glutamyl-tRNA(Gln) amidotransferase subunit C